MIQIKGLSLLIPLFLTVVILVVRYFRKGNKIKSKKNFVLDLLFARYAFMIVNLLYFPIIINTGEHVSRALQYNLVPFLPLINSFKPYSSRAIMFAIYQMTANLFLFVPLSAYIAVRFKDGLHEVCSLWQ